MNIIGIDTVKFFTLGNYYLHIVRRLPLVMLKGKYRYMYRHHNDAKIIFSFRNGSTTVSFSVPKLLYGDNYRLGGRKEIFQSFTVANDLIGLDLREFRITRLDITSDFSSSYSAVQHKGLVSNPTKFKWISEFDWGYYYQINSDIVRSTRSVIVYQKNDKVRFEVKFQSRRQSKTTASGLIKRFIKHEAEGKELLKESFYYNCVRHYIETVGSTLRGKKLSSVETDIRDQLYIGLRSNYHNTFNQSFW